jgi:hypothetical protein
MPAAAAPSGRAGALRGAHAAPHSDAVRAAVPASRAGAVNEQERGLRRTASSSPTAPAAGAPQRAARVAPHLAQQPAAHLQRVRAVQVLHARQQRYLAAVASRRHGAPPGPGRAP